MENLMLVYMFLLIMVGFFSIITMIVEHFANHYFNRTTKKYFQYKL